MNKFTIVVVLLLFVSCKDHAQQNKSGAKPGTGHAKGVGNPLFDIKAPKGWTKTDTFLMGQNFTLLRSAQEENDDFIENANVVTEDVGSLSLDEYYKKSLESIRAQLTDFSIIEEHKTVISHTQFMNLKYTHVYSGIPIDVDAYLAVHNKKGYVITCSTSKGMLAKWQETFDEIMASFSIH